jgi:cell division septation protein DedD
MNLERSIGFIFLISTILALGFLIEPQEQYKSNQSVNIVDQAEVQEDSPIQATKAEEVETEIEPVPEIEIEEKLEPASVDLTTDAEFLKESDFDLFVLRVHVLSSLDNAEALSEKIKKGGYPSFVEVFGKNKNLYAIYVGPFLSKEEISSNIEDIKEVSQSSQGEVTRWKL